jgi:hypothetical protein
MRRRVALFALTAFVIATPELGAAQGRRSARLAEHLRKLLPDGTDLKEAASGFRSETQFVAVVHVSYNLGIDFENLKAHMLDGGMSLAQAIRRLKPRADALSEAARATSQAQADLARTRGR